MQKTGLFEKWTMQGILDGLDTVELFEAPEYGRVLGEITKKQKRTLYSLGSNTALVIDSGMQVTIDKEFRKD